MKLHLFASAAAALLSAFSGNASATSLRAASLTSESADSAGNSPETEDYELASYEGEEKAPLDANFFEDEDEGEDEKEAPDDEGEDEGEDEKEAPDDEGEDEGEDEKEAPDDEDEDEDEGEDEGKDPAEVGSSNHGGKCYKVFSDMEYNALKQAYVGNPDKKATGFTSCKLCTGGQMWCHDTHVMEIYSRLIASHIHVCAKDGDDGKNCSGPPVINFCGDDNGILSPPGYKKKCEMFDEDTHTANINYMTGKQTIDDMKVMSLEERVRDIGMNPHKYYFNFHTAASWAHWSGTNNPSPKGMCRGRMEKFPESSMVMESERELENGQQ